MEIQEADPPISSQASRHSTLAYLLAITAVSASHLAMVAEVSRSVEAPWVPGGLMLVTNVGFGLLFNLVLRLRVLPLMVMISTAGVTEAFLLQSARSDPDTDWIVGTAISGIVLVAIFAFLRRRV